MTVGSPVLRSVVGGMGGGARVPYRYIRTWNGSTTYGTLNTPVVVASGDTAEIVFVCPAGGVVQYLIDGIVSFDASNLLQLVNCTATIDGVSVASGASIAAYQDGSAHTMVLTFNGADTATIIGANTGPANFFAGEILSVKFTDNSGAPVVTNYVFDDDNLVYSQARGNAPGAELVINGTFDTDVSGWNDPSDARSTATWESGTKRMRVTNAASGPGYGYAWQTLNIESGKHYYLSCDTYDVGTARVRRIQISTSETTGTFAASTATTNSRHEVAFTATYTGVAYVLVQIFTSTLSVAVEFDNISLKEIPNSVTWTNFIASDIELFSLNLSTLCWEAAVHADICYA